MKHLRKDELISIILAIVAIGIVALGIYMEWWALTNVLNYVPEVIMLGLIPLLLWGFRKRIKNAFRDQEIPRVVMSNENVVETKPEGITKRLGSPDYIQNGIQNYGNRSRLPLQELFLQAEQRVDMLAITFHTLTTNEIQTIRDTVLRGIQVTFVILDPNSQQAINRDKDFHEGQEIKHHIERSLHVLCNEKKQLPESIHTDFRNYLIIKTYDNIINHSIMIIDNKLIKIEDHPKGSSPDSRPSHLAFKDDNKAFFEQYYSEYKQLYSKNYECLSP